MEFPRELIVASHAHKIRALGSRMDIAVINEKYFFLAELYILILI